MNYLYNKHTSRMMITDIEPVTLYFILLQTAGSIIVELRTGEVEKELRQYTTWADHGYTNVILTQVRLIYNYIRDTCNGEYLMESFSYEEKKFLCKALIEYKAYKDAYTKREQEEHGKNFGTGTWFYTWNPCEFNDKFLK